MRRIALVPLLLMLLLPTALATAQTGEQPRIECTFEVEQATVGQEVLMNVLAWNVQELYAYQFDLSFDPEVIQVVDDDPQRPGVNARFRDFFTPDLVIYNQADNVEGLLSLGASKAYPAEPVSGSGLLAQIRMQVIDEGSANFTFVNLTAADELAALLDVSPDGCMLAVAAGGDGETETAAPVTASEQPPSVQTAVAGVVGTPTPEDNDTPSILNTATSPPPAGPGEGNPPAGGEEPDAGPAPFWRSVVLGFGGMVALAALVLLGLWLRARQQG